MVNSTANKNSHPICFQCGSQLIFVSRETIKPEGTRYPQTNTIYRCSNAACQEKKDKDKADREKLRLNREVTEKERSEKIQERRKLSQELKKQSI